MAILDCAFHLVHMHAPEILIINKIIIIKFTLIIRNSSALVKLVLRSKILESIFLFKFLNSIFLTNHFILHNFLEFNAMQPKHYRDFRWRGWEEGFRKCRYKKDCDNRINPNLFDRKTTFSNA